MINTLNAVSVDGIRLQIYLEQNFQEVYDFFNNEKHSILLAQKQEIDRFIQLKIQVLRQLPINNSRNLSFLTLLMDVSERFELRTCFQLLFGIVQAQNFYYGKRLQAASLYLIGLNTSDDYINRFGEIYSSLQEAFETEEDSEKKVLTTLINYYGQVVYNFEFNPEAATSLRELILGHKEAESNSFLHHPLVELILSIPIIPHDDAFTQIHQYLDSFLGRDIVRLFSDQPFLIEDRTHYSEMLARVNQKFTLIRDLNSSLYHPIANDKIFYSLQHGVKILAEESQLFAYMHSYGKMHFAKLISAFSALTPDFFTKAIRIVDWGCGQGMATMSFIDYLNESGLVQDVRHITLIEPSELALKRASLHSIKYTGGNNILTINRDLDSVNAEHLYNSIPTTKLHLFSNILDIDLFSMKNLLTNVCDSFAGENYFVCVSPYITDMKTRRIDSFVDHFSNFNEFEILESIDNRKGEWINGWTRVVRVFKACI